MSINGNQFRGIRCIYNCVSNFISIGKSNKKHINVSCDVIWNDKKLIFEESNVEDIIDFIKTFRNTKQANNIPSDFKARFDIEIDPIAIKLLKLEGKIVNEELDIKSYKVVSNYTNGEIYFEKEYQKDDDKLVNTDYYLIE